MLILSQILYYATQRRPRILSNLWNLNWICLVNLRQSGNIVAIEGGLRKGCSAAILEPHEIGDICHIAKFSLR